MTEIVADKTVEVVKNAIETADGALDLYNKYLDQVIPWQTFDEARQEVLALPDDPQNPQRAWLKWLAADPEKRPDWPE